MCMCVSLFEYACFHISLCTCAVAWARKSVCTCFYVSEQVYVCRCVRMCMCVYLSLCVFICMNTAVCVCIYMCLYVCTACVSVCLTVYDCESMYLFLSLLCDCVSLCVYIRIFLCVCMCVYVCLWVSLCMCVFVPPWYTPSKEDKKARRHWCSVYSRFFPSAVKCCFRTKIYTFLQNAIRKKRFSSYLFWFESKRWSKHIPENDIPIGISQQNDVNAVT